MEPFLLLPFAASFIFVFGMMFSGQAIHRGANPLTGTLYTNVLLGLIWIVVAIVNGNVAPVEVWPKALLVGILFLLGQLLTFTAYRFGDVSVATPVLGVKILFVAALLSLVAGTPVSLVIWIAAAIATLGVALVQWRPRKSKLHSRQSRIWTTVSLALMAAFTLSVFDVVLQNWGPQSGASKFLPIVFISAGISSMILLPWIDAPSKLKKLNAFRPLVIGSTLMSMQAMCMCIALAMFAEAPRINIVYALRGLWAVVLGWLLAKQFDSGEQHIPTSMIISRGIGTALLTAAVIAAMV